MSDTVLASIPRVNLNVVLTAFHRGGYGHVVRVMDPERAPVTDQLARAGVSESRFRGAELVEAVLLFVHAPKRTHQAAAIAVANGAVEIDIVSCRNSSTGRFVPDLVGVADSRRGRRNAHHIPHATSCTNLTPAD